MVEEPTIRVTFRWTSVEPDPEQFKPAKPQLEPVNMFVELLIPVHLGARLEGKGKSKRCILSAEAWAYASSELKTAMARQAASPGRR